MQSEEEEEEKEEEEEEEEKKKKKKEHSGCLATFGFGTFAMLFHAVGCVVRHKNTQYVHCYEGL